MGGITTLLLGVSILLIVSVIASKASFRFGVPTLLIFLAIGMLAGEDGFGIIFDDVELSQGLGIVALNFILFSGGLETKLDHVKPSAGKGLSLATVGVLVTAVAVAAFVRLISDFTWLEALLLGAVASSTDAAAVFSIFRTKKLGLKNKLRDVIELESASNDPMAYFLTVTLISLIQHPDPNYWWLIPQFLYEMLMGAVMGVIGGYLFVKLFNRIKVDIDGLYPVMAVAVNLFVYSLTMTINANGFLAVYITALYFGNSNFVHKRSVVMFYDGFAWLMQVAMFLTLGLLVTPSNMLPYVGIGLAVSFFLMLVARPLSVFASLSWFKMPFKDMAFVSWCGLRGAVPIVFATYPLMAHLDKASEIFQIVFYIVLTSMLIQGTTFSALAKKIKLATNDDSTDKFIFNDEGDFSSELKEIVVTNPQLNGHPIMDLSLPQEALIVYIKRGKQYITPKGGTLVQTGDRILILAKDKEMVADVKSILCPSEKGMTVKS